MGKLFLVATPIGNLGDLSPRAVETLKGVGLIAAEDTRNSIRLLSHFGIRVPLTSYHEYNRIEKAHELVGVMNGGTDVALITDAGMPAISDPGEDLVRIAQEAGIEVTVVPGPCAAVSALALSGLPTGRFVFEGFLPTDRKERSERLDAIRTETRTVIMYEAPHRLVRTLGLLRETVGGGRSISLARELTKIHEETIRTTIDGAIAMYEAAEPRGEYVLVMEGRPMAELIADERRRWEDMTVTEHVDMYIAEGMDRMDAIKKAAADLGVGKRDIYKEYNAQT